MGNLERGLYLLLVNILIITIFFMLSKPETKTESVALTPEYISFNIEKAYISTSGQYFHMDATEVTITDD